MEAVSSVVTVVIRSVGDDELEGVGSSPTPS